MSLSVIEIDIGAAFRQFVCGTVDPETVRSPDAFPYGHLKGLQTQCMHVIYIQHTGPATIFIYSDSQSLSPF